MRAQAARLGRDVLWTNGSEMWVEYSVEWPSEFMGEDGVMRPDEGPDGPVADRIRVRRLMGTTRDRKAAMRAFREWHEGRARG